MVSMGPSLEPDAEALAWTQSAPRAELWSSVTQPTLVILGEETIPVMPPAAESIVAALPNARLVRIPASDHGWEPSVMTPVLAEYFADCPTGQRHVETRSGRSTGEAGSSATS